MGEKIGDWLLSTYTCLVRAKGPVITAFLIVSVMVALPTTAAAAKKRLKHLRHIVLDPGHGGTSSGTHGIHGVYEKLLTLPIALEVEKLLRKRTNARVTLTRRTDTYVGLRRRSHIANEVKGDLFLSLHCNASHNKHSRGLEVYFLSVDSATREIANLVEREERSNGRPGAAAPANKSPPLELEKILRDVRLYSAHGDSELVAGVLLKHLHRTLGGRKRGVFQAPFAVLKEVEMPAVVVEVGFLTHKKEGRKLLKKAHHKRIARAIVRAIIELDRRLKRR